MLFHHKLLQHPTQNPNLLYKAEQKAAGFNQKLAVLLTKAVGTMSCAYIFALLAIFGLPAWGSPIPSWVQWLSQTFIQLVMLSVIMVGQSVISRKQELQTDEMYQFIQKSYTDIEQIALHLNAQDGELLKQTGILLQMEERRATTPPQ